jgi:ABC-type lipoprotein export system ATPase subunit
VSPAGGASIACVGLVHVYRAAGTDIAALRGVDLDVRAGERVALLGPSGSGKSTLLAVVAGIRRPSAGAVVVAGRDIARLPERDLRDYRAHTIGTMLQGAAGNLLGYASPADNLRLAGRIPGGRLDSPAADLLAAVGLSPAQRRTPVADLPPSSQQFAALAVALANQPLVLAADEPTSQLDPPARDDLLEALLRLAAERATTVLVVTHDAEVAARMDRTVHLRDGRVGAEGRTGAPGEAHEQLAVIGSDGALLLPEELTRDWPAGTLVRVRSVDGELRVTRAEDR